MNGLCFVSATFPTHDKYNVVQETSGSILSPMTSIEQWTDDTENAIAKKAYWATRTQNNCRAINSALSVMLKFLNTTNIQRMSVKVGNEEFSCAIEKM